MDYRSQDDFTKTASTEPKRASLATARMLDGKGAPDINGFTVGQLSRKSKPTLIGGQELIVGTHGSMSSFRKSIVDTYK
jgi:hypothetical protein